MITIQTAVALGLLIASYVTIFNLLRQLRFDLHSLNRGELIGLAFNGALAVAAITYVAYIQLSPRVIRVSDKSLAVELGKLESASREPAWLPPAAAAAIDPRLIGVLYFTNREFEDSALDKIDRGAITFRRSPKSVYGSAVVRVPEAHSIGSIERPTDLLYLGLGSGVLTKTKRSIFR